MLYISKGQMTKISASILVNCKVQLKEHVLSYFPIQCEHLDDDSLLTFIDECIETASEFSINEQAAIQSFVDHTILLGRNFHQNPLYPDLCQPLYDEDISDNIFRLDKLYDNTWAYLDETRGEDARNLFLAVSRLKSWLASAKLLKYNSLNLQEILEDFHQIFPEKYEAHSQNSHKDFIKATIIKANEDNFLKPVSQLIYVLLAFVAGINFYHDRLVIGTLKEHFEALSTENDQNTRYEVLLHGANIYLTRIITSARALAKEQEKD